jgi:hypothetical protein
MAALSLHHPVKKWTVGGPIAWVPDATDFEVSVSPFYLYNISLNKNVAGSTPYVRQQAINVDGKYEYPPPKDPSDPPTTSADVVIVALIDIETVDITAQFTTQLVGGDHCNMSGRLLLYDSNGTEVPVGVRGQIVAEDPEYTAVAGTSLNTMRCYLHTCSIPAGWGFVPVVNIASMVPDDQLSLKCVTMTVYPRYNGRD